MDEFGNSNQGDMITNQYVSNVHHNNYVSGRGRGQSGGQVRDDRRRRYDDGRPQFDMRTYRKNQRYITKRYETNNSNDSSPNKNNNFKNVLKQKEENNNNNSNVTGKEDLVGQAPPSKRVKLN